MPPTGALTNGLRSCPAKEWVPSCRDVPAAAFHRNALGLAVTFLDGNRYAALGAVDAIVALAADRENLTNGHPAASFEVADVDAAIRAFSRAAGPCSALARCGFRSPPSRARVLRPEGPHKLDLCAAIRDDLAKALAGFAQVPATDVEKICLVLTFGRGATGVEQDRVVALRETQGVPGRGNGRGSRISGSSGRARCSCGRWHRRRDQAGQQGDRRVAGGQGGHRGRRPLPLLRHRQGRRAGDRAGHLPGAGRSHDCGTGSDLLPPLRQAAQHLKPASQGRRG